ncbi:MAG: 2-oxoacid:acceptor oxidoreductase subunit alpha [Candidatus Lokiarchaeota archaeon]|nr:2-oxoacid:acceptor oxidoreductase subunit alpha [Candidatus Lokiarchaeota archaeon]
MLTGEYFTTGNLAVAEGSLAAGCKYFGGYPITPSSEVAEHMAERLPQVGGHFVQFEDELASIASVLGASWGGWKSCTATSGPGYSLMVENIGLGVMMETPCVIVNVQRGGPSTGLPTLVGQQDVQQARWGSHGDYEIIALSPNSVQECFDLAIDAFNYAEKYRVPVTILMDETIGHMSERLVIPKRSQVKRLNRKKPSDKPGQQIHLPYEADKDLIPPMAVAGEGYRTITTGLTHDARGYPVINASAQKKIVKRLCNKILLNKNDIIKFEEYLLEDAEYVLISFGISSRAAKGAVNLARNKGIKAGLLRLITIWPFADEAIQEMAKKAKVIFVVEINNGQITREVQRAAAKQKADVYGILKLGGSIHTPAEILKEMEEKI